MPTTTPPCSRQRHIQRSRHDNRQRPQHDVEKTETSVLEIVAAPQHYGASGDYRPASRCATPQCQEHAPLPRSWSLFDLSGLYLLDMSRSWGLLVPHTARIASDGINLDNLAGARRPIETTLVESDATIT